MKSYDYAIVGAGAAGLQLALSMQADSYFDAKRILIIERSSKNENDKTWCFWEKGPGKWDNIIVKSWSKSAFITAEQSTLLDLGDYKYKMLRSIDFYTMAKEKIRTATNIDWISDEVKNIKQGRPSLISTSNETFHAVHLFDSRIDIGFYENREKHIHVIQHFKGWLIESDEEKFDSDRFTMMDFRLKYPESTSFTYVLPYDTSKALVEFTFFSPEKVAEEIYDEYLEKYIKNILGIRNYEIKEVEMGEIPMSNYPFYLSNNEYVTKIGTAGSWVKGSSGYSFKNAEKYSAKIVDNIKHNYIPSHRLFNQRFRMYDSLFLDVLYNSNYLGEQLFAQMYTKNNISEILAFLDEETTPAEELKVMISFPWSPFIEALVRHLRPSYFSR